MEDNGEKSTIITGSAGFIGFHLAQRLLEEGQTIIGFDNLNDYYDVSLKQSRVFFLNKNYSFKIIKIKRSFHIHQKQPL
jgi:UDP-glucuronate 4-epimerase